MNSSQASSPLPIVWLASYPKAGNTWMRLMLMHLLHPESESWTPDQPLPSTATNPIHRAHIETTCLLDASLLTATECDLLRPRLYQSATAHSGVAASTHFFKVHDAYRCNVAGGAVLGESPGQRAVYLVRDPRDVAVSLAAFTDQPVAQSVEFMNRQDSCVAASTRQFNRQIHQQLRDWSSHVRSWLEQEKVPVLLVRYEDLRAAPGLWLRRVADFLGLESSTAQLDRSVRLTTFQRLQRAEAVHGFCEHPTRGASRFFRRARPGEWCAALTPELVLAIESAHGAMMQRLGYQLSCERLAAESLSIGDPMTGAAGAMNAAGETNDYRQSHR